MNRKTQPLLALLSLAAALCLPVDVAAVTFSDAFATSPFPTRWCERFHHVHWGGSSNQVMKAFSNGACHSNGSCCLVCETPGCTSLAGPSNALITKSNYTGLTRSASIDFRFPLAMVGGSLDHIAILPVFHPNCHTGYEGIVAPAVGGGYTLSIGRVADTTKPECNMHPTMFSSTTPVAITLGTTPRFRLSLDITTGGPDVLNLFALVFDTVTSQTLATKSWTTDLPEFWYNTTAKRFGFGHVQTVNEAQAAIFDNFSGAAN